MDETERERFVWHPEYRGQTRQQVQDHLRSEIASDQRAYSLALEAADERENDVLQSVITLEKRWGDYDMGWAETDPADLAERVAAFEWEREQRREIFPYTEYRDTISPPATGTAAAGDPWWAFWRR
ncbi:MAG TPA: hypothetical protein VGR16_11700 [Thermomicrobiales bacterium]|nr:hypothetical protein [Thermomicrobiales bacterium]